ncbi:uncharacterized protein LOC111385186 [Olea europaea var. sylvestris]|uniref:uncharacterized protein LOC111385186 n=1 Tax=Olea europaea var. sylvestris TaxID=158386 RepID=UPI000C1D4434|nr:uncharacterized protein LOC111385186 [Olea europaea var. sylvestris]
MAANSQQFGTRLDTLFRHVNEVDFLSLEQQLTRLTSLVHQMATGNIQTMKAYGICSVVGHSIDMCPTLQKDEQVNAVGSFPGQPQRNYNPYSNTYKSRWRDHPNLSYGEKQVNQPNFQQYRQPYLPRQQQDQTSIFVMSLEDIVKSLATNTLQFQQETKQFQQEARVNIKSLENQMGQMAIAINKLEAQGSGKLPSQTMVNPRENACAITLKNGKKVEIRVKIVPTSSEQQKEKDGIANTDVPNDNNMPKCKFSPLSNYKLIPPLPHDLEGYRKDVIKQIPRYAKFLKHLFKSKRKQKLKGCEKVNIRKNVSAIIQRKIPKKCLYPETDENNAVKVAIDKHMKEVDQELPSNIALQETIVALNASLKSGFQMEEVRTWGLGNPIDAG